MTGSYAPDGSYNVTIVGGSAGSGGSSTTSSTITAPLGSETSAQSVSVVIANDQAAVQIKGSQGTSIATSLGGNIIPLGLQAEASNATAGNNPIRIAGWDGTMIRTVKTDGLGQTVSPSSVFFTESSTPLAASGSYTGTARDTGVAAGSNSIWAFFNAFAYANQNGTLYIQGSDDGSTWVFTATQATTASASVFIKVPVVFRYYRMLFTNGATANTAMTLRSSYSVA